MAENTQTNIYFNAINKCKIRTMENKAFNSRLPSFTGRIGIKNISISNLFIEKHTLITRGTRYTPFPVLFATAVGNIFLIYTIYHYGQLFFRIYVEFQVDETEKKRQNKPIRGRCLFFALALSII